MPEVLGRTLDALTPESIRDQVADLLSAVDPALSDAVVLVPDIHYPFHPSTGMVTHPAAVAGALDWIEQTGRRAELLATATAWADADEVLTYLGYDEILADHQVDRFRPKDAPHASTTVRVNGDETVITRPVGLDGRVLVVPTLRTDGGRRLFGALDCLAAGIMGRDPTPLEVAGVGATTDAVAVLDASYAYVGRPNRSAALLGSEDAAAVDRFVADRPGWSAPAAERLRREVPQMRGFRAGTLATAFPRPHPDEQPADTGAMAAGYRAYARITGDLVPPQVIDG